MLFVFEHIKIKFKSLKMLNMWSNNLTCNLWSYM